jgi:AmmeMemoRadiSam system protein B
VVVTEEQKEGANPKVRPLEAFPLQVEGKEMFGLKDPIGIAPEIVFVPPEALFLISLMNGSNSLRDMQAAYMRKYRTLLFSDKIAELVAQLDSYFLLENHHFEDHLQHIRDEFKKAKTRKAAFVNRGYEADSAMLKTQLTGYFTEQGGPGLPDEGAEKKVLQGFVAPHIDFTRGGTCYAHAYKAVGEANKADLFCILGTCHTPMRTPFAFTRKTFETPLGTVEVAQDIVEVCAHRLPFDPFHDEFSHRTEHAIEFQVVFLKYLLGERAFTILPILCGSFHDMILGGVSPMEYPPYHDAVSILKEQLAPHPSLCLVASADLAHVGPQFGDGEAVTPGILAEVKAKDEGMLGHVANLQEEDFYRFILQEGDRRNICGLPPIYALLHLIKAQAVGGPLARGHLLNYQQWSDPSGTGAVTFASMAFR